MTHHEINPLFALHNHVEIVHVLNELAKHRVLINLTTDEGDALVTTVLYVSGDRQFLCLDVSKDEDVNQRITDSKLVSFETQSDIKVRWQADDLQWVTAKDGLAFALHVPTVIERVQRREYFRLHPPQGNKAMICRIPVDGDTVIEVTLLDMSAGGIGVIYRGSELAMFEQGKILEGCSMDFPEIGRVPMSLRVCGIWQSSITKSGDPMHRIGLQFVGLSRGVNNVIQRYMIELEAQQITPT